MSLIRLFSGRFSHVFIFHLFFHTLSFPSNAFAATLGNETDKLALLDFKSQIMEDPDGLLSSWNDSFSFCNWLGVKCSQNHQRVVSLDLQGHSLVGTMSPFIGNLSFLQVLNLGDNSFRGNIPSEIGHLFRLQNLNLSFNFLEGAIPPNLSRCSNLQYILIDHNYLVGHIPPELGSLPYLVKLYLKNNNLTGSFPSSIGNLTNLQELYLSYNNLSGEVPASIFRMRSLTTIGLSVNSLSGVFPPPLYNLSSLRLLSLSFNLFTGSLRPDIGLAFPNLQNLYLAQNFFNGLIPVSLCNATQLQRLDLPINTFSGKVPVCFGNLQDLWWFNILENRLGSGLNDLDFLSSLTNCSQLQFLDIAKNNLGGELPASIANLSIQLTKLLIGNNRIYGEIPGDISNLVNLDTLSMPGNYLTGIIPALIGKLLNLKRLHLESNQLTGEIPSSLGNISQILNIYIQNNSLVGSIPTSLGNCQSLQTLDLSNNKLSGTIPIQIFAISSLSILLNLSYNSLVGPLPEDVGNLTTLAILDVSCNNLSGEIPSRLGICFGLEQLLMKRNFFQRSIPSLSGLKNIHYIDFSHNNLSGLIPESLAKLSTLFYLDLSFNNLEGEVPFEGVFKNASQIEVSGNFRLCGGIQGLNLHPCPKQATGNSKKHIAYKLILVMVIVASGLALMVSLFWFFCVKKVTDSKPHLTSSSTEHLFRKVSYGELLNATDGFSPRNLIGSGNFGTVYRGVLGPDEEIVAVKVLNLQQRGASKSFIAECEALKNIRHRNLAKIHTACSSIDFEGNDFKAMVYEYMPNGSLDKWLHPEEEEEQRRSLSIFQRINVAIDVASALDYLHNHCQTPVAHCDIKPSNVLLRSDFTAHVSDFGLAQLLCKFSKEATMNQFSSLGIKGTIGYAAPEYGMDGKVSLLGDVYSYGVLLLELFTGKRPTNDLFKDNLNLHNFVKMALPSQVMEIVDQSALCKNVEIREEGCSTDLRNELSECLLSILKIGVLCSSYSPQNRMSMGQVIKELLSIREKLPQIGKCEGQILRFSAR